MFMLASHAAKLSSLSLRSVRIVRSVFWAMLYSTLMAVVVGVYHDVVQVSKRCLTTPDCAGAVKVPTNAVDKNTVPAAPRLLVSTLG